MTECVREIAVKGKDGVLHQRIHAEVEALDWFLASRDTLERLFKLGEVLHLDHKVEFAEPRRAEAQLAPGEPPSRDQILVLEIAQVRGDVLAEFQIADPWLEITPGMVDVQVRLRQRLTPVAITAAIGTAMPSASR